MPRKDKNAFGHMRLAVLTTMSFPISAAVPNANERHFRLQRQRVPFFDLGREGTQDWSPGDKGRRQDGYVRS